MNNIITHRYAYIVLLFIAIISLSLYFNKQESVFKAPYGQHIWRQCDGLGFVWNYTYSGNGFLEPKHINVYQDDGKMCPEFPIVYYVAAKMNMVFGERIWYTRAIHFFLFVCGLFALSYITKSITHNTIASVLVPLLLYSSPTIVYYSDNYLPDISALSFSFIGIATYIFSINRNKKWLTIVAISCVCISGILKPTALNMYLAFLTCIVLAYIIKPILLPEKYFSGKTSLLFFVPLLPIAIWIAFTTWYNKHNNSMYMNGFISPLWGENANPVSYTYYRIKTEWIPLFINYRIIYLSLAALCISILSFQRKAIWAFLFLFILSLILTANALLFFHQFLHHEYYLIVFVTVFISIWILFYALSAKSNSRFIRYSNYVCSALLCFFIIKSAIGTKQYLYTQKHDYIYDDGFDACRNLESTLEKLNITKQDRILCWGDKSSGISLVLIGRRGYTMHYYGELNRDIMKKQGVNYIMVNSLLNEDTTALQNIKKEMIWEQNPIKIYRMY